MSIKWNDSGDFTKESIYADFDPAILVEKGLECQAIAETLAIPHIDTGEYISSFSGFLEHASNGHPYYRVYNTDPAAVSIEFGTAHDDGQHILGKAIDAMGDDKVFIDTSKTSVKPATAEESLIHAMTLQKSVKTQEKAQQKAKKSKGT